MSRSQNSNPRLASSRMRAKKRALFLALAAAGLGLGLLAAATDHPALSGPGAATPIDRQRVQDQDLMTWDDYRPIPGKNWADPALKPERGFKLAVVGIDFPGQPFVITLPKGSDPFEFWGH